MIPNAAQLTHAPSRNTFHCGDMVAFELRYLRPQLGTIVCLDPDHATVDTGDGVRWRIRVSLLLRLPMSDVKTSFPSASAHHKT